MDLERLLELYPCAGWDWAGISEHIGVSWEFIQSKPWYPWDIKGLTQNPSIPIQVILDHLSKSVNTGDTLSSHPDLTVDIILKNPDKPWNWSHIFHHSCITWEIIQANPVLQLHLDKLALSLNPNIPISLMANMPDPPCNCVNRLICHRHWIWQYNPNLTWQHVLDYPAHNWDWKYLSQHLGISIQTIIDNPEYPWNWSRVCYRSDITWDHIRTRLSDSKLMWNHLSEVIPCDIIMAHLNAPWVWENVSDNPTLTWEMIRDYPDKAWSWSSVLVNPGLTWEDILVTGGDQVKVVISAGWIVEFTCEDAFDYISVNPNLTWEFIHSHPSYRWNWFYFCSNKFSQDPHSLRYKQYRSGILDVLSIYFNEQGIGKMILALL